MFEYVYVYICVCNNEWSMRQDCDSGLHNMLMSTNSLKLLLFAVEGMVKLHFIWRKQTGTRGDSQIERLAFTYRASKREHAGIRE